MKYVFKWKKKVILAFIKVRFDTQLYIVFNAKGRSFPPFGIAVQLYFWKILNIFLTSR
jgi:hypothetical protein